MPEQEEFDVAEGKPKRRLTFAGSVALPIALFLLALVVRFIGLKWGLPTEQRWYSYHPDERDIAAAVFQLDFFSGDFNPNFYNYPSLFIYLTYLAHLLAALLGLTHQAPPDNPSIWPILHDVIF